MDSMMGREAGEMGEKYELTCSRAAFCLQVNEGGVSTAIQYSIHT